ncbi:helix-turn-helix domain protein [Glaciecola sp. 4H-3-7+YE-5]|jgi:transcriptional regulator with XRE-family HTH domain|nr:helix-turn-helix domain protein [Glaciecola sp. 4H-3-7+YE-5]
MKSLSIYNSPHSITESLGKRLKRQRLNRDMTQAELGARSGTSRNIVKNAENGKVSLINLVAILQELGVLEHLDVFLYEPEISPLQLVKLKGKVRQRAGGTRKNAKEPVIGELLDW